jgi:hypothetical protein
VLTSPQTLYAAGFVFSLWFVLFLPVVFGSTDVVDHGYRITDPKIYSATLAFVATLPTVLAAIILCGPRFKWRALVLLPVIPFAVLGICCDIFVATGLPAVLLNSVQNGQPVNDLTVRMVTSDEGDSYTNALRIERKTPIPWLREYKTLLVMRPSTDAKIEIIDRGTRIRYTVGYENGHIPIARVFAADWHKNVAVPRIWLDRTY